MKTGDLVYWVFDDILVDRPRVPLIYLGRTAKQVNLAVTLQPNGYIGIRWINDLKSLQ